MDISNALSSLTFENGDYIKDQTSYADYYEGSGWFGSLTTMVPGYGYMLKKNTPGTLIYPSGTAKSGNTAIDNSLLKYNDANVSINPHDYRYNGSVTAKSF